MRRHPLVLLLLALALALAACGDDDGGGTGVWVGNRDPGAPGLFFFWPQDPPAALEAPTVPLACQMNGAPLAVWDYVVLGVGRIAHESALAGAMDRTAFPMDPFSPRNR